MRFSETEESCKQFENYKDFLTPIPVGLQSRTVEILLDHILYRHRCKSTVSGFILTPSVHWCKLGFFLFHHYTVKRQHFFLIRIPFLFSCKMHKEIALSLSARSSCFFALVSSSMCIFGRIPLMRTNAYDKCLLPLSIRTCRNNPMTWWIYITHCINTNLSSPKWLWSQPAWPAFNQSFCCSVLSQTFWNPCSLFFPFIMAVMSHGIHLNVKYWGEGCEPFPTTLLANGSYPNNLYQSGQILLGEY